MLKGSILAFALAALASVAAPGPARAQVFLASRPNPEFAIGPLFVRATVTPTLGPITVDVLWSLAVPSNRSALGLEQDLFLLWPGAVRGAGAGADPELGRYFGSRGFTIVREGTLPLLEENLYPIPGGAPAERLVGRAAFVTFSRPGRETLGLATAASYVQIPWTPTLTNRTRLLKLRMVLDDLVKPRKTSWVEDAFWGPRFVLSIGFSDVREQTMFPVYLENRARTIRLADEPSRLLVSFTDADRLRIDEVFRRPAAGSPASRRSAPRWSPCSWTRPKASRPRC